MQIFAYLVWKEYLTRAKFFSFSFYFCWFRMMITYIWSPIRWSSSTFKNIIPLWIILPFSLILIIQIQEEINEEAKEFGDILQVGFHSKLFTHSKKFEDTLQVKFRRKLQSQKLKSQPDIVREALKRTIMPWPTSRWVPSTGLTTSVIRSLFKSVIRSLLCAKHLVLPLKRSTWTNCQDGLVVTSQLWGQSSVIA